jgi:hypothetical protein
MTATRKGNDLHARTLFATAALALGAATSGAWAGASTGPAQIRITDLETQDRIIHPADGSMVGSIEIVRQRLYNPSITNAPIGRADIVCTFLDRRVRTCTGTYVLPKGTLVVTGAIQTRLLYEISIVGGTGLFNNARGTLTVTSTHLRPRREVLLFRLAG